MTLSNNMPRIFPFVIRRSNSYNLHDCNEECNHLKARLRVGADYIPAYEIIDVGSSSNTNGNKELFFIRIAQQGLIISHKPSVNLSHLGGSLDPTRLLPPSKRVVPSRRDTLRPICHRSKSDRCRLIKWHQIDSIQCLSPKTMVFKLKSMQQDEDGDTSNHHLCVCPHNNNKLLVSCFAIPHSNSYQLRFEFLLTEDLHAFITSGLHYQIIERDSRMNDNKSTSAQQNPYKQSSLPSSSDDNNDDNLKTNLEINNMFSRLTHTKDRMIRWIHRHAIFRPLISKIEKK